LANLCRHYPAIDRLLKEPLKILLKDRNHG
jgi:hypothetical protein